MEDFRYGGTNITAFRLVDPNSPLVQEVVRYGRETINLILAGIDWAILIII
jgi:hypothetical protein